MKVWWDQVTGSCFSLRASSRSMIRSPCDSPGSDQDQSSLSLSPWLSNCSISDFQYSLYITSLLSHFTLIVIFLLFLRASVSSSLSLLLSMSLSPAAQHWSCTVTGILISPLSSALTPSPLICGTLWSLFFFFKWMHQLAVVSAAISDQCCLTDAQT